jgi:pimeloyl-ACP methyl ester carboxylesterase
LAHYSESDAQLGAGDAAHEAGARRLYNVILVPGIVNPGELSFGPLLEQLKGKARVYLKELEVYRTGEVPQDYGVGSEVEGIRHTARAAGLSRFHLVGYSAGGLAALGYIAKYPDDLLSVTMIEQFGTGNTTGPAEQEFLRDMAQIFAVPTESKVATFLPLNVQPGVEVPTPPLPLPAWMALRPAGIDALVRSALEANIDRKLLRRFTQPVLVVFGSLSHPVWRSMGDDLASVFPDCRVAVYEDLHHLSPPQRSRPAEFSETLLQFWPHGEQNHAGHTPAGSTAPPANVEDAL